MLIAALALLLTPAMAPAALAEGEVTRDELLDALHDYFNGGDREQVEAVVDSYFNAVQPPGNLPQGSQQRNNPPGDGGVQGAEGPVQGQGTETVLVSNIGQPTWANSTLNNHVHAQGFTTGANSGGYTLTSVDIRFGNATDASVTVQLATGVTAGSTTAPNIEATLINPTGFSAGNVTFTAPANTTLNANTTYYVYVSGTNTGALRVPNDGSEDSGGAAGWSMADQALFRFKSGAWTASTHPTVLRVNGFANPSQGSPSFGGGGGGGTVYPGPWITPRPHHVKVASARTVIVTMDQRVELDSAKYSRSQLAGSFSVHFNGVAVGVNDAYIAGGGYEVHLGLTANAPRNQKLAVNYSSGPLLDATDANRRPISGFGYYGTGRFITPKPHAVERQWRTVTVYMDKAVQLAPGYTNAQLASAFLVRVDGVRYTPISARLTGGWGHPVELILPPHTDPGGFNEPTRQVNMAVEYTKDPNGNGPLQESAYSGNQVESFGHYGRTSPTE